MAGIVELLHSCNRDIVEIASRWAGSRARDVAACRYCMVDELQNARDEEKPEGSVPTAGSSKRLGI